MNIALFASGSGSNAEEIIKRLKSSGRHTVSLIVCNNPGAFVITRADNNHIPVWLITKNDLENESLILSKFSQHNIGFIVLAGFLLKIPGFLVRDFPNRIINIHPALLPKFGGKGMYGKHVHEAALAAGEKESGITIHYVNDHYDEGKVILQKTCPVELGETLESLEKKIHALEHRYFPETVESLLDKLERESC